MIKITSGSDYKVYAALRMIEQLTNDKLIPEYIFKNILNDHRDVVEKMSFIRYTTKKNNKGDETNE